MRCSTSLFNSRFSRRGAARRKVDGRELAIVGLSPVEIKAMWVKVVYEPLHCIGEEASGLGVMQAGLENINWLNFGMDYETQKDLFIRGAKAAEVFFSGGTFYEDGKARQFAPYDWEKFKKDRAAMVAEVQKATGVSS